VREVDLCRAEEAVERPTASQQRFEMAGQREAGFVPVQVCYLASIQALFQDYDADLLQQSVSVIGKTTP
jgi:hypothetical protein